MSEKNINSFNQIGWDKILETEPFDTSTLDVVKYWGTAIDVINAWSQYRAKVKLYVDATHQETYHKVRHVIDKYYNGNPENIQYHEAQLSRAVNDELASFDDVCAEFAIERINRQWLYDNLRDAGDYDRIRQKCRRRLKSHKPAESLRDLV